MLSRDGITRRQDITPLPRLPRIMKLPAPNLLSFSGKSTNTGPPKRSDERKSPIDINILPGWKSNRKPKVEMRVPETESCGQSQSQGHHAVSSWTQPFQDPGNNLIQNRQSSTFDISRILIQQIKSF
jgi:hypothetical protein